MASSDFDWDGFLGKRASRGGGLQELAALAGQDAALRVDQISNDLALAKSAVLEAKQREQRDSGSWVSNLGLTPGTAEANTVNVAASLASGASRVGGFVSSLGPNIGAIVDEYQASDADYAAYARYQKGTPTREDQLRLNRSVTQVNHGREGSLLQSMPAQDDGDTILSRIQRAENRRQLAADITARFDNSGIVHQGNRDGMNAQLKDGFDKPWQQAKDGWNNGDLGDIGTGLGKLALNVGQAAIDHPMAATEYIAENVPQLALGAFGKVGKAALTADNMGYGADMYTKGITEYQRTHKGAMPGVEHRKWMGSHAAGAVIAEQAMDLSLLKGMGIGEEIAGVTAKSFKKTLLDAAKTVGKGLGGESLTEGVQTYAEGEAGNKPAKAVDIYVGSAIGGMSGGGMASVIPAVDVLAASVKALTPTNLGKAPVEHSELFKKAVAEGNPDLFLDPDQESYDPKQALSVLQKMASAASTSAEDKANYQAKAQGVLESVDTQIAALRSMTDEGIAANKQKLDSVTAQITKAEADGNAPRAAALKKMAGILQKQIDDSAAVTPEEKAAREASIKELTKTRDEASKIYDLIVDESAASQVKDLDVQATLAEANAAVDPAVPESATKSAAAVKKLMVLSMVSPDALSGADAQGLASNTANGLSTQERSYLTAYATAADAIATLKSMPKVSKEIFDGDPALNQKGILTYQQNVGKFLSVGDMASAERELKGLANFLAGHKSKSTVMTEALAKFKTTKQPLTVIKDATGKWSIPGAGMKVMALHTNTIGADSAKLVANVRIEAQAIEETLKSLQAARDLVKSQKTKPAQQTTATAAPTNVQASPAQQPADVEAAGTADALGSDAGNVFKRGPQEGERYRVGVSSATGGVTLEKRLPGGTAATFYVGKDGGLIDADDINLVGTKDREKLWIPTTPEQASQATAILDEMGRLDLTDPKRKDAKARLKALVTSTAAVEAKAKTESNPVQGKSKYTPAQAAKMDPEKLNDELGALERKAGKRTPDEEATLDVLDAQMNILENEAADQLAREEAEDAARANPVEATEVTTAPWDEQPTVDEYAALRQEYPDATFRPVTEAEQAILEVAIPQAQGILGGIFSKILVHTGDRHLGLMFYNADTISLNADLFTQGIVSAGVTDPVKAVEIVLVHEGSHANDQTAGFPSQIDPELKVGGAIYTEALAIASDRNNPLYKWLKNPVFGRVNAQHGAAEIASELYAQSFALYTYNPELMNEHFPAAYAFVQAKLGNDTSREGSASTERGGQPSVEGTGSAVPGQPAERSTADAEVSQFPGSDEQVTEAEENTAPVEAKLNVLVNAAEDSVLTKWLKQAGKAAVSAGSRPLTSVKDFMSAWRDSKAFPEDFLKDADLDVDQSKALNFFYSVFHGDPAKKVKGWSDVLRSMVPLKFNEEFNYEKVAQYFIEKIDGRNDFEENIKAAMVMAGLTWTNDTYANQGVDQDKQINQILNRDEKTEVSKEERAMLPQGIVRRAQAADSIGRAIVQALGLKADKDASASFMPKLEAALGMYALDLLMDQGVVQEHRIKNDTFQKVLGGEVTEDAEGKDQVFVRLAVSKQGSFGKPVMSIVENMRGSKNVLEKLFSVEPRGMAPTFEPVPFNIKRAKGSRMGVPKWLAEILDKKNHEENFVEPSMLNVFHAILGEGDEGMSTMLQIAGAKVVDKYTHISNIKGIEAKAAGLRRELVNFLGFVKDGIGMQDGGLDTPFFLQHEPWNQQRVGILNGLVNPQNSKIVRYGIFRKSWEAGVDTSNTEQMDKFKLRVMEGLGVKTDKQGNEASLAQWASKVENNEVIQAGVAVMVQAQKLQPLSAEQRQTLLAAVKAGGEDMHTLHVLAELAKMASAVDGKFTSRLVGEIDGVTNGPMFSSLLLGAAYDVDKFFKGFLNKGGFFEEGSGHKDYNVYRGGAGVLDLYETVASKIINAIPPQAQWTNQIKSVFFFTGELAKDGKVASAGRNIVKRPVTALNFGSSTWKAVDGMAEDFIDNIYKAIEKVAREDGKGKEELIAHINTVVGDSRNQWNPHMTVQAMLSTEFDDWAIRGIKKTFNEVIGETAKDTLEMAFYDLLARRDSINSTASVAFGLYDTAYKALEKGYIEYLTKQEGVELDAKGNLKWDLTPGQQKRLDAILSKMQPVVHTLMSLRSGKAGLSSGLSVAKVGQALSQKPSYKAATSIYSAKDGGHKNRSLSAIGDVFKHPGVSAFSKQIHSFDSGVSHQSVGKSEALNNHDANTIGFMGMDATAVNLNEATWDGLLEYSPANEMFMALARTVQGLADLLSDPELSPDMAPAIKGYLESSIKTWSEDTKVDFEGTPTEFLKMLLNNAKQTAFAADTIRLGVASKMETVNQYALEGGGYQVKPEQRKQAEQMLASLTKDLTPEVVQAMATIAQVLEGSTATKTESGYMGSPKKTVAEVLKQPDAQTQRLITVLASLETVPEPMRELLAKVNEALAQGEADLDTAISKSLSPNEQVVVLQFLASQRDAGISTPFGNIGPSSIESDPAVAAIFEATPEISGKALMRKLKGILTQRSGGNNAFLLKLMPDLYKALDSVAVHYVTPLTMPADVLATPETASRGWTLVDGTDLYVLSPEFANSGLDVELLLHELTHTALQQRLDNPASPEQEQAVAELNDLLAAAKAYVKSHFSSSVEMNSAVSSIHELVSWGMYNQKFQTEVLRKVSVKTPQGFVGGMKQFIDSLLGLLGMETKTSQEDTVDGFTALLVNASLVTQAKADANARQIKKRVGEVLSMVSPTPEQQIDNYTTEAVFAALSGQGNSLPFTEKLQGILADVVTKLHGPFGLIKTQIERTVGKTVQDTWAHAQATGQRVFAAKVLASGMRFSQQEAYVAEQVEAVVRIALENKAAANSQIYNELEKLYTQARSTLKGKIDPDVYAFVFYPQKREGDTNKSDYLSVFAAMALSNEEFNKALSFETHRPELSLNGMTFMERIGQMWCDFSDLVGAMMTGTRMGQQANSKVKHLVNQLVQIEARNKHAIKSSKPLFELMAPVGAAGKTMIGVAKDAATKVVESAWVKENKNGFIRLAGAVGSITVNDRIGTVVEGLNAMRDATEKLSAGEIMSMVNYVKGIPQWTNKLLLMGKQVDKNRLAVINDIAKAVLHEFKNQGKDLTEADKTAVSAVLLRPGLFVLEKSHGVSGIQQMLENAAVLQAAIDAELAKIQGLPEFEHYVMQAKGLAWYRVMEEVGIQQQMFNAGNIARMFGTGKPAPATATQAEPVIEQLIALYAMQYADTKHKKAVIELMRSEANRGPKNGIEMVLKMQQYQDTEARAKLFQGSEALMMHGFTPEILNPHTTFKIARSVDEEMELEDLGYVRLPKHVPLDPADTDQREATMYVLTGGGMGRRTTGLFSYTGMAAKGKAKHDNFYSPNHAQGVSNMQSMTSIYGQHEAGANAQVTGALAFDPRKVTKKINYMAPIVNAQGQVVDYRYMMKGKTKDTILQRDNRFEHILGVMAGATYDKPASREQNKRAVEALRAHYEATSGDNPDGFITVHGSSSDPRMREAWDLLPDGTKQDIRAVWGAGGMKVPKRMVDVLFGYRKASLADAFDKEDQNGVEKYMVAAVSSMLRTYARTSLKMTADQAERYSRRGAVVVRRFEAAWQELVQVTKDMIVVKSGTVMVGNIVSNLVMLAMKGVPIVQGAKYQLTALRGAMDYERDRGALAQLKALQQVGYGSRDVKEIQAEVVRLEDSLARNPIKQLIDSGLMPTIVEDIAMEEDVYSYKSQWSGWVDDKLSGMNPHVKTVGRTLYMAHDTSMYKFLSKTTQYSDFVARYALYMHLTQRKDGALSHDDAVFEASETFVNYDNPLPKHLQYLDDMGLAPFIKYFFSIQRVLVKNLKDDPLRVLSVLSLVHFLGNLPMPTDSSFLARIGNNPLDIGALGIGGAAGEMMTAQAAMTLIK